MARFRTATAALLVLGLAAATAAATFAARSDDDGGDHQIALRDHCDPDDPGWAAIPGGCQRKHGSVTAAEFDEELDSPLSPTVIGHQAWRIDPSYLVIKTGRTVRVRNAGGRPHTFTEVAEFGGGKVPPLSEELITAPECPGSVNIPPGGNTRVSGLSIGNHRFQCCIHPWQRALIKVRSRGGDNDDD